MPMRTIAHVAVSTGLRRSAGGYAPRVLLGVAALALMLAFAPRAGADVFAYPSSQTIPGSGPLPQDSARAVTMNAAIGEREGAWIVVNGAQSVSASIDGFGLGPVKAALFFGHFVNFSGRFAPDALLPWDGAERPLEKPNQPLYLQVFVPQDARPGGYRATLNVVTDGRTTAVPVTIKVYNVRLPAPNVTQGNLLTAFHVVPESYVSKADELFQLGSNPARSSANVSLFAFLASYRISPAGWGFGEPRVAAGYTASHKWWLDAAGNMIRQNRTPFATMRIPISNQRASVGNRIAGISPFEPDTWCSYLESVRSFWDEHGWLDGRVPYLYTVDEPGPEGMKLVAEQAAVAHRCFPGSRMLVTGNPSQANRFLWDDREGDDADIWAVLSRRYYGQSLGPREKFDLVAKAGAAGKQIWSSTYTGVSGTPGYTAAEPLSNPRMFLLWNALEGIKGTLYAQGMTSYYKGNPFDSVRSNGEYVLLYPGPRGPIASARLEQIRDGIEDWDVLDAVRRRRGLSAVRAVLAGAGLFSATARGVKLACVKGCELRASSEYSWPQWSHDAATAQKIEAAKRRALTLAAG
jgi:Glycoside hydrolase 123, catalytic domain